MPTEVWPRCTYCSNQAQNLIFYSKSYPSGKDTIEAPLFICEECRPKGYKDLSVCRGGIEGIVRYSLRDIALMSDKKVGVLCGKRNYERNELAVPHWRKIIFRVHKMFQPSKKERLIELLEWYKSLLEKNINSETEFDRKLSTLLTCVDEILKAFHDPN